MTFLKLIGRLFLLPGTIAINTIGITVEEDGGILRSLINMIFWGFICVLFVLPIIIKLN